MPETKSKSSFATTLSLLSLIIACASFYVSYQTQQLSIAEDLTVRVVPQAENLFVTISPDGHWGLDSVFIAPFEVTLSNTGNRKLSVVRYEVFEVARSGARAWYNNLDGGLVDSKAQPLKLPIVLDAGESALVYARIGLMASGAAVRAVKTKLPDGGSVKPGELFRILAQSGVDVYGNSVKRDTVSPEGYVLEEPDMRVRTQHFTISFQTGKGSVVTRATSWHRAPEQ